MLTERRKRFCHEYIKDCNIQQSLIRAGLAPDQGHRVMRDIEVQIYIKQLIEKYIAPELTASRVLEEMRRIAFSDIRDYYKYSEKKKKYVLKALDELTAEQASAIAKYAPGEGYYLHDKQHSLGMLGKHFKLFTDLNETLHSFTVMETITIGGKPLVLNVGKPKKPV